MPGVIQLLFGAVDVTTYLMQGTITFVKEMNQSWQAQFSLYDPAFALNPIFGQPFTINEDGNVRFTGFLNQIIYQPLQGRNAMIYQCTGIDWSGVTDRRVITETYLGGDIGFNVIQDINTRFLSGDGIEAGMFVDGSFFLPSVLVFNPSYVRDALNQLRDLSGRQWWVDENKHLHFALPGVFSSITPLLPFWLVDNDGNVADTGKTGPLQATQVSTDFRNVQIVKTSGPVATQTRTETFTVTSTAQWFIVPKFQLTAAPTVTVNGVAQSIFQFGVDAYGQNGWYWTINGYGIQQGQQIAPAIGSIVQVTYDSISLNYVTEQNSASITARQAIEGGSGIWENIANLPNVDDLVTAQSLATGMLSRGIPETTLQFDTYRPDFTIGSLINVWLASYGIGTANTPIVFTVQKVEAQEIAGMQGIPDSLNLYGKQAGAFMYTVYLSAGSPAQDIGGAIPWMQRLIASIGGGNAGAVAAPQSQPASQQQPGGTLQFIREEPTGTKNGSNLVFTISHTPVPPFFFFSLNGAIQSPFAQPSPETTADYSLSGTTITMRVAPEANDEMFVQYVIGLAGGSVRTTAARSFAGGTDGIDWGNPASLFILGDMSVGIWVEFSSSSFGNIIGRAWQGSIDPTLNTTYVIRVSGSSGSWDIFYAHDHGSSGATDCDHNFVCGIPNNTAKYVGFSRDTTAQTVTLFLGDGLSITQIGVFNYPTNPDGGGNSGMHVRVGQDNGSVGAGFGPYVGDAQEHYIWNRKLTMAEHQAAMKGSPSSSGLQLACLMGNSPEIDISGNALSGTVTGTTLIAGIHP